MLSRFVTWAYERVTPGDPLQMAEDSALPAMKGLSETRSRQVVSRY